MKTRRQSTTIIKKSSLLSTGKKKRFNVDFENESEEILAPPNIDQVSQSNLDEDESPEIVKANDESLEQLKFLHQSLTKTNKKRKAKKEEIHIPKLVDIDESIFTILAQKAPVIPTNNALSRKSSINPSKKMLVFVYF